MASLQKIYGHKKIMGQIYTPDFIVSKILDEVGYNSPEILGKRIIDPACGDGRFLCEIVRRIIKFSPIEELNSNLSYVYGWDIDKQAIDECIKNLNKLVNGIDWNVAVTDSIKQYERRGLFSEKELQKFDYIVGNPPYIRIQHLTAEQRQYVQLNYDFCQNGSTDIYIAFFELCISMLSKNGICGLITPNTYMFTDTARKLRRYFIQNGNLIKVINYGDIQLFENATTYSAITILNNSYNRSFSYNKALSDSEFIEKHINVAELSEQFWFFEKDKPNGRKLKDICDIHVGIATLCDGAYIFQIEEIDEQYVWANTKFRGKVKLERAILRPIIKASKLKSSNEPIKEYVLFPYKQINGKHQIISEKELQQQYPFAYSYLLSIKSELDKRDNGKPNPVAWYAFGRSQGLDTSFGEKIIFSPINHKPNFVLYSDPNCTFYSGYCIKYDDAELLLPQLNSERMQSFVASASRDFRGGWKAYNKKVIESFAV